MAMATVLISFMLMLSDLGIGAAIVHDMRREDAIGSISQGMMDGQRFGFKDIQRGAGDVVLLQCGGKRIPA